MAGIVHGGVQENFAEQVKDGQESSEVAPRLGYFVLAPVSVANPTIGISLQVVLLHLHSKGDDLRSENSNSWLAGIFHIGEKFWLKLHNVIIR